jgi:hypothetical protein
MEMNGIGFYLLVSGVSWLVGLVLGIMVGRFTAKGRVEPIKIVMDRPSRKEVVGSIRSLSKKLGVRVKINPSSEIEDLVDLRNRLDARNRLRELNRDDVRVMGVDHEQNNSSS